MSQLFPDNVEPKMLHPARESVSCAELEGDTGLALWPLRELQDTASRDKGKEIAKGLTPWHPTVSQNPLDENL